MIRATELLRALSLATDLGSGRPLEHGLRVCSVALALAEAAGVEALEDVYCAALLHPIGCTSDAFEAARLYGDDRAVRAGYATVDGARPAEVVAFLARYAGSGRALPARAVTFASALVAGPRQARAGFAAHCEVGVRLALPAGAQAALEYVFEAGMERATRRAPPARRSRSWRGCCTWRATPWCSAQTRRAP